MPPAVAAGRSTGGPLDRHHPTGAGAGPPHRPGRGARPLRLSAGDSGQSAPFLPPRPLFYSAKGGLAPWPRSGVTSGPTSRGGVSNPGEAQTGRDPALGFQPASSFFPPPASPVRLRTPPPLLLKQNWGLAEQFFFLVRSQSRLEPPVLTHDRPGRGGSGTWSLDEGRPEGEGIIRPVNSHLMGVGWLSADASAFSSQLAMSETAGQRCVQMTVSGVWWQILTG